MAGAESRTEEEVWVMLGQDYFERRLGDIFPRCPIPYLCGDGELQDGNEPVKVQWEVTLAITGEAVFVKEKYSEVNFLVDSGIEVAIDSRHAIAHNKVMVIDGETVITGSFNFTRAAEEHNAENLLVIRSKELARKYSENWRDHREHSRLAATP